MKPTSYLNFGSGLVFLILGMIVAMGWFASKRVGDQHTIYLRQQAELRALDQLLASANRIISSTNEFALIALTIRSETSAGEPAPAEASDEDGGGLAALNQERQLIEQAKAGFQTAYAGLASSPAVSRPGSPSPIALNNLFEELVKTNNELLASLDSAGGPGPIFELKEKQEVAEMNLLAGIGAAQTRVQKEIEVSGGDLASDFRAMNDIELGAGLLAALILLTSTVFISRRVGGMFAQIGDQRLRIETANNDLNAALESLRSLQQDLVDKEKFSTLGRLTATVSHELRNPLAAIRNSIFVIKQGVTHLPEMTGFVARIERNILRCDHIIADLLEYTRTRELDMQPVDLCPWLEAFAKEQDLPANISLVLDLDSSPVMASLDEFRFRRAIVNLVENAAQAIAASRKPGQIKIECRKQADGAVIAVEDDGPGIPDAIVPRIFEPLFTTKNFGAGLGLSIARNLVTQHGGTIGVDTRMDKGTRFSIRLPLADNCREKAAA